MLNRSMAMAIVLLTSTCLIEARSTPSVSKTPVALRQLYKGGAYAELTCTASQCQFLLSPRKRVVKRFALNLDGRRFSPDMGNFRFFPALGDEEVGLNIDVSCNSSDKKKFGVGDDYYLRCMIEFAEYEGVMRLETVTITDPTGVRDSIVLSRDEAEK